MEEQAQVMEDFGWEEYDYLFGQEGAITTA